MGGCESSCINYLEVSNGYRAAITLGEYGISCKISNPSILTVSILRVINGNDIDYTVVLGTIQRLSFKFLAKLINGNLPDISKHELAITHQAGVFTVNNVTLYPNEMLEIIITITLNSANPPNNDYILDDQYIIKIKSDCAFSPGNGHASVEVKRPSKGSISSDLSVSNSNRRIDPLPTIPRIQIEAQTTLNGSDIGDSCFTIYDEFTYYNLNYIPDNICKNRQTLDVKSTIFRECCPYMVSVVKGNGITLLEKLQYLYDKYSTFNEFYGNISLYGMAKYILSRLLYGKFNINYLLGKYNDKFLKNLRCSRFCAFVSFFDENDYNKYFLITLREK